MSASLETSEAAILDRVLRVDSADWPPAAASAILAMRFDESDRARMVALLERAKAGELAADEADELKSYEHIGRLLELMKSRARRSLKSAGK